MWIYGTEHVKGLRPSMFLHKERSEAVRQVAVSVDGAVHRDALGRLSEI